MDRPRVAWGLLLLAGLLSVSCGGGGSSPTDPGPVPESLEGMWSGQLSGSGAEGAFTCSIEVNLSPVAAGNFFGNWDADCPDGSHRAFASAIDFGMVEKILIGFSPSTEGVLACGWSALTELRGNRLVGDWEPPDNCEDPAIAGGSFELVFRG
jgi:hypothetical protein